ncbi:MAG: hypothetical protein QXZ02_00595 [Candidatus Bathyarchaeia archaeon]
MSKAIVTVKFRKKDLSYLVDYLVEDLRVWNEKGFESKEERERFQQLISIINILREANREKTTIFI